VIATDVIRQVLAYTRETTAEPVAVDLAAVVDRALALRRYQLGRAGIAVDVTRSPGNAFVVMGEKRQLQQLVLNLLLNAEQALARQPQRVLRLALERHGARVRLVVADSGAGVPAELRDRIFEPFFTTSQSERTVGLGLTVSRAIAASHGGTLLLEERGPGATFVLELPAR